MPRFGDLGSKFSKTSVRFENSTFDKGHRENFVKIKKLTPFDPKCTNLGIWAQKPEKQMSDLKSAPSK